MNLHVKISEKSCNYLKKLNIHTHAHTKKFQIHMASLENYTKHLRKEIILILNKFFQRIGKKIINNFSSLWIKVLPASLIFKFCLHIFVRSFLRA